LVVRLLGDGRAEFTVGRQRVIMWLVTPARNPRPSEVTASNGDRAMVVSRPSGELMASLARAGWSWVSVEGAAHVLLPEGPLELSGADVPREAPVVAPSAPRSLLSVLRVLLVEPQPSTQRVIAHRCGITQARVSQVLGRLRRERLLAVGRAPRVADPDVAARWWLDRYPGPSGTTTSWYGLGDPWEQALRLLTATRRTDGAPSPHAEGRGATAMVSGDLAADLIAPWRRPLRAHIYARAPMDPADHGFVAAGAGDGSTLSVTYDDDPVLWGAGPPWSLHAGTSVACADVLQAAFDVGIAAGSDADQAVRALLATLPATAAAGR